MHADASSASSSHDVVGTSPEPHHVLVVEDDAMIRRSLQAFLEVVGECRVDVARDGQSALDMLHGGLRPCAIILDLAMPRMSGWQLRAKLLQDPELARIPVAVFTAYAHSLEDVRVLRAQALIRKTANPDEVLAFIDRWCTGTHAEP